MVVLAVAIVTKNGKALVSRQFVETSRLRIEGLLAAFPKLIAAGSSSDGSPASSKQHTFVETDSMRYLYLPFEGTMYLVLLTNRASNIIEDLETLRLLSKLLPEQIQAPSGSHALLEAAALQQQAFASSGAAGGVGAGANSAGGPGSANAYVPMTMYGQHITEELVAQRAFELLLAVDEVVTHGGFREDGITLHQVRTNLEMESHEEKLAQMIKVSKMQEAKEAAKKEGRGA